MSKKMITYVTDAKKTHGSLRLIIEEDDHAGFYIYVYDAGGQCIASHVQDNISLAYSFCKTHYAVDETQWVDISNGKQ